MLRTVCLHTWKDLGSTKHKLLVATFVLVSGVGIGVWVHG